MKNKKILKKLIALVCATTILAGGMTVLPKDSNVANAADVPAGLEGYTRITPEDFGIVQEKVYTYGSSELWREHAVSSDITSFDNKYFDADISITNYDGINNRIAYMGKWNLFIHVGWNYFRIYSNQTGKLLYEKSMSTLNATAGSYFNIKIATNVNVNSSNTDITLKVWVNNTLVKPLTEVSSTDSVTVTVPTNQVTKTVGAYLEKTGTIKIKPVTPAEPVDPNLPQELLNGNYKRITPSDFSINGEVIRTSGKKYERSSSSYNKTYFEAEIAINNKTTLGTDNIIYGGRYNINIFIDSRNKLMVRSQVQDSSDKNNSQIIFCERDIDKIGIELGEYFNIKIALDVTSPTSTTRTITPQIWVNNEKVSNGNSQTMGKEYVTNIMYMGNGTKIKPPAIECVIQYNDISPYRKNGNVAPTAPDGYIFAGWFTKETCELNEAVSPTTTSGSAYAKFIDKHLLRIQAQIPADTKDEEGATSKLRFVTSIDSLNYNKVGFTITTNANDKTYGGFDNIVYDKLTVTLNGDGTKDTVLGYTPRHLFGSTAVYYKAWIIEGIPSANYDSEFYATPYLETLDGTIVYGTTATKTVRMGLNQ